MLKASSQKSSKVATLIGILSVIMWALAVCYIIYLKNIPTFEMLAIIYFFGFIACAVINTKFGLWKNIIKHPKYIFIIGIIAIFGQDFLYIIAFKYAPEIHVELVIHLWPMMVLLSSSIFLKESFKIKHLIACTIAFYGVYILLTYGKGFNGLESRYILGYVFTFIAAALWTMYVITSKYYGKITPEMFSVYCGFGLIISCILHVNYEHTVIPSLSEYLVLCIMGITTHSLAYFGWDYAINKGNYKLLSILSHGNVIISVCALTILGFSKLTIYVLIATMLVSIAGLITCINWRQLLAKIKTKKRVSKAYGTVNEE